MIKLIKKWYDYYKIRYYFRKGLRRQLYFKISDGQASPWFIEKEIKKRLKDEELKYNLTFNATYKMVVEEDDWMDDLLTINVKYSTK